ncbi:MAG: TonB-dependent receptor, partial [Bacteroidota bacterium]
ISIRGFGARSAFGIRGVKLIVDGIPETTPDGQGQVDNLNLGIVQNIEVIKGAAAVWYGNAAGGVININTLDQVESNFLELGTSFGWFTYAGLADSVNRGAQNMQQYQLKGGFQNEHTTVIVQASHNQNDGYRRQSGVEQSNVNARLIHQFSPKARLSLQANWANSPQADDPGGIDLMTLNLDRSQARDRNVLFQTGEQIHQFKTGAHYEQSLEGGQSLEGYGFFAQRDFTGRLPFENGGWIELNRHYFGQGASYQMQRAWGEGMHTLRLGYEWAYQSDERQRFANLEGQRGNLTLDQVESFGNVAVYGLDQFRWRKWLFQLGLRYDWNRLASRDRFLQDGDNSGSRRLSAWNPSLGLSYALLPQIYGYLNFRTSFETPALSELSANPDGSAGFNTNLAAQRARNYEVGIKGKIKEEWFFDATYFHIDTRDELVPFELAAFPGRSFFRNAGKSRRDGVELSARYRFWTHWSLNASYTFMDLTYTDYVLPSGDFSGNQLPGVPRHFAAFALEHRREHGFNFRVQGRYTGALFLHDANALKDDAYFLVDTSLGYRLFVDHYLLTPFVGLNNVFNQSYNDNIRINAFGNRFFEPGPELNIYIGLRLRWEQSD